MSNVEVVIIGSGLAGLSAALEATNEGAKVTIVEKNCKIGGNSSKATSGINGVRTKEQIRRKSKDSVDIFINDTLKGGYHKNKKDLVVRLVSDSSSAIDFLEETNINLCRLAQCGGHSEARTHRHDSSTGSSNTAGKEIIVRLYETLKKKNNVKLLLNTATRNIQKIQERFIVTNYDLIKQETTQIECDAVIIASGGYAANFSLIKSIFGTPFPTTNGPFATGDLLDLVRNNFDAKVTNLKDVQIHPTGIVDPNNPSSRKVFLAPEALRGYGGLLINEKGKRFVDELSTRDVVQMAIRKNCSPCLGSEFACARLVLNDSVISRFGSNYLEFYRGLNLIGEFEDGEDFCRKEGIDVKTFQETLRTYNECVIGKRKDEFGKTNFSSLIGFKKKMYRLFVTPSVHYSMGGIMINRNAEVLTKDEYVVKGLFSAGEATTGVHGSNRLAGNSLLECVVFGRIAGRNAAMIKSSAMFT